jgi:hypothetical protein
MGLAFSWQNIEVPVNGRRVVSAIFKSGVFVAQSPVLSMDQTIFPSSISCIEAVSLHGSVTDRNPSVTLNISLVIDDDVTTFTPVLPGLIPGSFHFRLDLRTIRWTVGPHRFSFYAVDSIGCVSQPVDFDTFVLVPTPTRSIIRSTVRFTSSRIFSSVPFNPSQLTASSLHASFLPKVSAFFSESHSFPMSTEAQNLTGLFNASHLLLPSKGMHSVLNPSAPFLSLPFTATASFTATQPCIWSAVWNRSIVTFLDSSQFERSFEGGPATPTGLLDTPTPLPDTSTPLPDTPTLLPDTPTPLPDTPILIPATLTQVPPLELPTATPIDTPQTVSALQSIRRGSDDSYESAPISIGMIAGIASGAAAVIAITVVVFMVRRQRVDYSFTIDSVSPESGGQQAENETLIETGAGLEFYAAQFSTGKSSIDIPNQDLFALSDDEPPG